ncbi:MAG: hypothetical protein WC379_01425 [Methanoregula sp.]|jgi:hypothetical protein
MIVKNRHIPRTTSQVIFPIIFVSLFAFIAVPASAGIPPPEYRAGYMLPQIDDIDQSIRDDFIVTDEPVPEFPNLSQYHAYQNILYKKTGEHYISEVWYFTDKKEFLTRAASIQAYLASNGEISNTTIDLFPELAYSKYPGSAEYYRGLNYTVGNIPAIEYRSTITSGYLVILPNHSYIAYYGRAGPYHPGDNSSVQKVLMMTVVPPRLGGEFGHSFPPSQENIPWALLLSPFLWLKIISVVVIGIVVFRYILPRREKS